MAKVPSLTFDTISECVYVDGSPFLTALKLRHVTFNGKESIRHFEAHCFDTMKWERLKNKNPFLDNEILSLFGKNPKFATLNVYG